MALSGNLNWLQTCDSSGVGTLKAKRCAELVAERALPLQRADAHCWTRRCRLVWDIECLAVRRVLPRSARGRICRLWHTCWEDTARPEASAPGGVPLVFGGGQLADRLQLAEVVCGTAGQHFTHRPDAASQLDTEEAERRGGGDLSLRSGLHTIPAD